MMNLAKKTLATNISKAQLLLGFFIFFVIIGCTKTDDTISISGFTMGTTYSIKIIDEDKYDIDQNELKPKIDSVLTAFNQQMSTYIEDSEISIFNNRTDNAWQKISNEFYTVLEESQKMSQLTNGAFDITIGPLVDLWGFGGSGQIDWNPPSGSEIALTMNLVGYDKIQLRDKFTRKLNINTVIDLNAIAKGYGVDIVFDYLVDVGYKNILVEIGGEVRCSGFNQNNEYWKVGIDKPILEILPGTDLQTIVSLDNEALATSGDYRNYFIYNDKLYSHTINPRTGYPIENGVASASVIAPNCMTADAFATALMVMGKEGIGLIEKLENVEALIIERIGIDEFEVTKSSGWN